MCGIAGIIQNTPVEKKTLFKMGDSMKFRGPDGRGFFIDEDMGFIHQRLSIIDLEGGQQPIFNEDKTLAIICNGEIYDYKDLREKLISRGHKMSTNSDSEVILHLYEEKGEDCLSELNGMFAFAIFHLTTKRVFIARDRFGQKPLFYSVNNGRLAFASGPNALRCVKWVDQSFNDNQLLNFLHLAYIPAPESIYKGIFKLLPGHSAFWNGKDLEIKKYWEYRSNSEFDGTYEEAVEEFKRLFRQAVHRRLVADVNVGTFLSGGIDSSLVTLESQLSNSQVNSYSIGFAERKFDERDYANAVAARLGTKHHFLEVDSSSFELFGTIQNEFEEPFGDASMLPTYLLSKFSKEHVTVALSGDGADELFGGYERYVIMNKLKSIPAIPGSKVIAKVLPTKKEERTFTGRMRRLTELFGYSGVSRYLNLISRYPSDDLSIFLNKNQKSTEALLRERYIDSFLDLDCQNYMQDDILVKVDRASMANSLEVRSPFLDKDLAEFAMRIPRTYKITGTKTKAILKSAYEEKLPSNIFTRPKMGFGIPLARWFRGAWKENAKDLILSSKVVKENFDLRIVERILQKHVNNSSDESALIFSLCSLSLWANGQ